MSNLIRFNNNKLTADFNYAQHGVAHLQENADAAAESVAATINALGSLTAKLVFEEAPKLLAFQEEMTRHRCWTKWLETKFDKSARTAYNAIAIYNCLAIHEEKQPGVKEQLSKWSQRSLLALASSGENREVAIKNLISKTEVTELDVKEFLPLPKNKREQVLSSAQKWAENTGENPEKVKADLLTTAKALADGRGLAEPTLKEYVSAFKGVTGAEMTFKKAKRGDELISGVSVGHQIDLENQLKELRQKMQYIELENNSLRNENEELKRQLAFFQKQAV